MPPRKLRRPVKAGRMVDVVTKQHANPNTVLHCLYAYYNLGFTKRELADIYVKSEHTIGNWIHVYEATGTFERVRTPIAKKFTTEHKRWLCEYYHKNPLAYLDEAQAAFKTTHHIDIAISTVWRIIHDYGLTWKVLERRAMHVKEKDVHRFVRELALIDWCHSNLVFLDEVSFDNRGMIRRRGYALRGQAVAVRGDFSRKPRVSILAFAGVHGMIDYFDTDGTFDRVEFVKCCRAFAYSARGKVRQYPGRHSVWILDGASIHRHPEIVHFLRSIGVVPIFLPAYCPFFNPIEYLFGYIKRSFKRHYVETSGRDIMPFVVETFQRFERYDMSKVFARCGWKIHGQFDPRGPMAAEQNQMQEPSGGDNDDDAENDPAAAETLLAMD